jgi:hypothetical protein
MIVTNKMLLPILLSHLSMSKSALQKEAYSEGRAERFWRTAANCVERPRAMMIIAISAVILAVGLFQAHRLKVGDYGIGVPELRPESVYNLDNKKIVEKFAIGGEHAGRGGADQERAGRVHQLRSHVHDRALRLVHAERPGHAVGDLAAGPGQDGQFRLQRGQHEVAPAPARSAGDGAERDSDRHRHGLLNPTAARCRCW